jgi:plastocyanin
MKASLVRLAMFAGLLQLVLLAPPAVAEPAATNGAEVKIDNFTFGPQRVTVKPGTTVTWINEDDIPHTVVSTSLAFRSKVLDTDDKFSFTFTTAGTFEYFCSLHPHMTGTIVVETSAGGGAVP